MSPADPEPRHHMFGNTVMSVGLFVVLILLVTTELGPFL